MVRQGVALALDKLFKTSAMEQAVATPEPEQIEKLPEGGGIIPPQPPPPAHPITTARSLIPQSLKPPPVEEKPPEEPPPEGDQTGALQAILNFPFKAIDQLETAIGSVVTFPYRAIQSPEQREYDEIKGIFNFYPGGEQYEAYKRWKGSKKEPTQKLLGIPSFKQLKKSYVNLFEGIKTEDWEDAKIGMGDIAEFLPWIFTGVARGTLTLTENVVKNLSLRLAKKKGAEVAINKVLSQLIGKGKIAIPTTKLAKEAEITKPAITRPSIPEAPVKGVTPPEVGKVPVPPEVTKQLWEMTDDELLKVVDIDIKARVVRYPKGGRIVSTYPKELNYKEGLDVFRQTAKREGLEVTAEVAPKPAIPKPHIISEVAPAVEAVAKKPLYTETGLSAEATAKLQTQTEAITAIKEKMVGFIKEAKTQRKIIEAQKHEAIVPKVAEFGERLGKAETVGEVRGAFGAMVGRNLPEKGMELEKPLIERLSDEEAKTFIQYITSHPVFEGKPLTAANTVLALAKKEAPTLGELRNLRKVLGDDFIKAYMELGKSKGWAKAAQLTAEIINIPKALFATGDFASSNRQAIFMTPRYPIKALKSIWTGFQGWFRSEKWVNEVDDAIRNDEFSLYARKLDLPELPATNRPLTKIEEAYGTSILYRIPLIKWFPGEIIKRGERVFVLNLNKFRKDIFNGYARIWRDNVPQKTYDELSEFINIGSGRGAIHGETLKAMVAHMNNVIFSIRLQISRVQALGMPLVLWKYSPPVRKVALGNIAAFWGSIGGTLALIAGTAKYLKSKDISVETNPIATDFGMLKVKDTRHDYWGGHLGWVRFAARLITGKLKTSSGEIIDIDRTDEIVKQFRLKSSPFASLMVDLMEGKTVIGEELTTKEEDIKRQIFNRITSGAVQDLMEAFRLYGTPEEAAMALPSFASIGVNTYPSRTYMDWLDKMEDVRGKEWAIEEIAALRPDFNATEKTWYEFLQLAKGRERNYYREENPGIDASLYFWGEVNNLLSPEAQTEFKKLTQKYNVDEDIYPLRVNIEEFEAKGKKKEEIFTELLNDVPSYMAQYINQNKQEWLGKDMGAVYQTFADMRKRDDLLLSRYDSDNMGKKIKEREQYRQEHPEVDAALNLWGRVTAVQSNTALALLRARADELGIPQKLIPALIKARKQKKFKVTLPSETIITPKKTEARGGLRQELQKIFNR